jgi:outer membrane receptor for ferrienterochelin and colicins
MAKRWDITWNMKWVGVMPLPEVEDVIERPLQSDPFALHHVQLRYQSARGLEVWVALRNVFDYTQPAPLIGAEDPFGEAFDASYIYGPLQGRNGVIGVRYHFTGS